MRRVAGKLTLVLVVSIAACKGNKPAAPAIHDAPTSQPRHVDAAIAPPETPWQTFAPPDKAFEAQFPQIPIGQTTSDDEIATMNRQVRDELHTMSGATAKTYAAKIRSLTSYTDGSTLDEATQSGVSYAITVTDFGPQPASASADMVEGAAKRLLNGKANGKSARADRDGHVVVEGQFDDPANSQAHVEFRAYAVGGRMYLVLAAAFGDADRSHTARDRFFNGFKVTAKADPAPNQQTKASTAAEAVKGDGGGCDFDALVKQAAAEHNAGHPEAAVVTYQSALKCKSDPKVLRKAIDAACSAAGSTNDAQYKDIARRLLGQAAAGARADLLGDCHAYGVELEP